MIALREKTITLSVKPSISRMDYVIASLIAMSVAVVFCVLYIAGAIFFKMKEGRLLREEQLLNDQDEDVVNQYLPGPVIVEEVPKNFNFINFANMIYYS